MSTTSKRSHIRQPTRQSTGGQFAEETKAGSGLALDDGDAPGVWVHVCGRTGGGMHFGPYDSEEDAQRASREDDMLALALGQPGAIMAINADCPILLEQRRLFLQKALADHHAAFERVERASAGMVVAAVRAQHPQAVFLELEDSDQGNFYDGGAIRDLDGKPLGDYAGDDGPGDHDDMALTNLPNGRQMLPFITEDAQDRLGMDLDAAMAHAKED